MMENNQTFRQNAVKYYTGTFRTHGPTARGVDWPSVESQILRLQTLLRIVPPGEEKFVLLDYGCGYGALVPVLAEAHRRFRYIGYDPAGEILACARERLAGDSRCVFVSDLREAGTVDYAVASGVWNVKQDAATDEWTRYLHSELKAINAVTRRGMSFNILTSYADEDRKRPDLYYGDARDLFDHCIQNFSRKIALLHDYLPYEFTILVHRQ